MMIASGSDTGVGDRASTIDGTDTELVRGAQAGSADAWNRLVEQYAGLVWHVVRSFRLGDAASEDVAQSVWMTAVAKLHQLRDPERVGAWLATMARHASIAEWNTRQRQVPVGSDLEGFEPAYEVPDRVVEDEERRALLRAFAALTPADQQLLRLTVAEPHLAYEDIAELVGRPIGSLGPSRARALQRLRRGYEAQLAERVGVVTGS
jgi:RNA polymerase sigma factor (sigma-70 family)